jgi:hypothetical protein
MTGKKQFQTALYFFSAIALLGLILRTVPVYDLGITYSNFLHAHSHVAFLGWLHGGFVAFISYIFLKDKLQTKKFKFIYLFTILNIAGMYFSFPIQGYKLFSIIFLSLFLIGTYLFLHYFFKNKSETNKFPVTYRFVRAGLWLQFLSSLSPWSLVFVLKLFGKKSNFYKYDIFYYLHFQYNGWFLFASIGLVMYLLERRNIHLPDKLVKQLYYSLLTAVFLGYFSNTLWANPGIFYNILSLAGGAAEIGAFFILLLILKRYHHYLHHSISDFTFKILTIVLFTFMLKTVMQFMGSFQYYADLSYQIRDFIIGYLHLIMLGIFTPFLLVLGDELDFFVLNKKYFMWFYSGFLLTETIIFARAIFTWFNIPVLPVVFNNLLFIFTLWMFAGIVLLVFHQKKKNNV